MRTVYTSQLKTTAIFGQWGSLASGLAAAINGGNVTMIIYRVAEFCLIIFEELIQVVLAPQLYDWSRDTDYMSNDDDSEE